MYWSHPEKAPRGCVVDEPRAQLVPSVWARGKGWEDVRFLCVEIHPPSMFTFNFHLRSFIFIWQSPSPPLFWNSFSAFSRPASHIPYMSPSPHFTPFISPHQWLVLIQSHLLHLQFSPCFSSTAAFSLQTTWKNVILLCFHNLVLPFLQILHTSGVTSQTIYSTRKKFRRSFTQI